MKEAFIIQNELFSDKNKDWGVRGVITPDKGKPVHFEVNIRTGVLGVEDTRKLPKVLKKDPAVLADIATSFCNSKITVYQENGVKDKQSETADLLMQRYGGRKPHQMYAELECITQYGKDLHTSFVFDNIYDFSMKLHQIKEYCDYEHTKEEATPCPDAENINKNGSIAYSYNEEMMCYDVCFSVGNKDIAVLFDSDNDFTGIEETLMKDPYIRANYDAIIDFVRKEICIALEKEEPSQNTNSLPDKFDIKLNSNITSEYNPDMNCYTVLLTVEDQHVGLLYYPDTNTVGFPESYLKDSFVYCNQDTITEVVSEYMSRVAEIDQHQSEYTSLKEQIFNAEHETGSITPTKSETQNLSTDEINDR